MSTEELLKLRNSLPKNYLAELHDRTGRSTTYIWQVLNEKGNNDIIIDAAIILAEETSRKLNERKAAIANL